MKFSDDYRFGFSEENIKAEIDGHKPIIRAGCYIPTVKDVRELPEKELGFIIDEWLWESPATLIPNNEQIREVIQVLESREDLNDCSDLMKACVEYIGK